MAVETVTLSGSALAGADLESARMFVSQLPATVCLGRIRPPADQLARVPRFRSYFAPERMASPPPSATNWRAKAAASIAQMYLNNQLGCCVISGKGHSLGVWSANDSDSGGIVIASDSEIHDQYQSVCGPGDNGCQITAVLDYMKSQGFLAGGKRYKIDGYVACDWTNKLEVQVVQQVFGASTIGINLPQAWTQNAVWDVTDTPIVGGHDVTVVDYSPDGIYISSWGRIYLMTWAAFTSRRWIEEYYALLAPLWYGSDKLAPNGIDAAALASDLAKLGGGVIPDPGPAPVPPPPVSPGPTLDQLRAADNAAFSRWARQAPYYAPILRQVNDLLNNKVHPPLYPSGVDTISADLILADLELAPLSLSWGNVVQALMAALRVGGAAVLPALDTWLDTLALPLWEKAALKALLESLAGKSSV